ncbi:transposase [Apiospora kogelbergensis]|uniref:transposase n=1 Tax=Apiospora kogelbergensis TaxID=1337665 RepID=UPI003130E683
MKHVNEQRIEAAIQTVLAGKSLRQASKDHHVDRTTLSRRLKGRPSLKEVHEGRQLLTPLEEHILERWALTQCALGYAPSHHMFKMSAQRILQANGITVDLGRSWIRRFLKRHPSLKTTKVQPMDFRRLNGTSDEAVRDFFARLDLPHVNAIPPHHLYNVDEIGSSMEMGKVASSSGLPVSVAWGWTTVVECISADGRVLPPLAIFKGASVQQQWFPDDDDDLDFHLKDWLFAASPKGWTNEEIGLLWLQKLFIPHTQPADPDQWRLLVLDGHGSHTTAEFMMACLEAKIFLVYLPAHTSHILQPLDVGPFSTLKRRFRTELTLRCLTVSQRCLYPEVDRGWVAWDRPVPRDISKPYNNRLRRGDRQIVMDQAATALRQLDETGAAKLVPGFMETPKSSRQLRDLGTKLAGEDPMYAGATCRILFSKVAKTLDSLNAKVGLLEAEKAGLEANLERSRVKKRKRVIPDPNKRFVDLRAVKRAKAELDGLEEESAINTPEESEEEEQEIESDAESEVYSVIEVA